VATNNQNYSDSRDQLLRPQAAGHASLARNQLLASQSFFLVDALVVAGLIIVASMIGVGCLLSWPKQNLISGTVRLRGQPVLITADQAGSGNAALEIKVTEGQQIERGAIVAIASAIGNGDAGQIEGGRVFLRTPVSGFVAKIEMPNSNAAQRNPVITVQPNSDGYEARFLVPPALAPYVQLHKKLKLLTLGFPEKKEFRGEVSRVWVPVSEGNLRNADVDGLNIAVSLGSERAGAPDTNELTEGTQVAAVIDEQRIPLISMLVPGGVR
jgi:hypothetical protein